MALALSKKSWLGVAHEATSGTAATAPTLYVPTKSIMKRTRKPEYITDERGVRDDNNEVVYLTRMGECDPKGNWYNDSTPYFVYAALGSSVDTQPDATNAPTAYQHVMTPADVLPSLTLFKSYHSQVYVMAYTVVEKFSFKFSTDKVLEFDATAKGIQPVPYTGAPLTPAFSSVKPYAGYMPTVKINTVASLDVDEVQVDYEQKMTYWYAPGSADFIAVYPGGRSVKVDFTARFDTTTVYDFFRNDADIAVDITFQGPLIASTTYDSLEIAVPVVSLDSADHDLSKDNVLVKVKGTARPPVSGDLITVTSINTVASYAA